MRGNGHHARRRVSLLIAALSAIAALGTGCGSVGGRYNFRDADAPRGPFPLAAPQVTGALWDWFDRDAHTFRVVQFTDCGITPEGTVSVRLWTETRYSPKHEGPQVVSDHPWFGWHSSVAGLDRLKRVAAREIVVERAAETDLRTARHLASDAVRERGTPVGDDEAYFGSGQGGIAIFSVLVRTGDSDEQPHAVDCLAIWDPRAARWADAIALPARREEQPNLAVTALTLGATPFALALDVASGPPLILVGGIWYAATSAIESLTD